MPRTEDVPEIEGFTDLVEIGRGGFSVVFAATETTFARRVAVKVINATGSEARRFEREALALGALTDISHVVQAHSVAFTADGRPALVMPLMPQSLSGILREYRACTVDQVVVWAGQIATALDHAHARGIAHRDIKPENILVSAAGDACLADFGIATFEDMATATVTSLSLSPTHAPPERFTGIGDVGNAGDIYSFASTLYTALAGYPPFGTTSEGGTLGLLTRVANDPVPPIPDVALEMLNVLNLGLSKDPSARPESARALAAALASAAHGIVEVAEPAGGPPELSRLIPWTPATGPAIDQTIVRAVRDPDQIAEVGESAGDARKPPPSDQYSDGTTVLRPSLAVPSGVAFLGSDTTAGCGSAGAIDHDRSTYDENPGGAPIGGGRFGSIQPHDRKERLRAVGRFSGAILGGVVGAVFYWWRVGPCCTGYFLGPDLFIALVILVAGSSLSTGWTTSKRPQVAALAILLSILQVTAVSALVFLVLGPAIYGLFPDGSSVAWYHLAVECGICIGLAMVAVPRNQSLRTSAARLCCGFVLGAVAGALAGSELRLVSALPDLGLRPVQTRFDIALDWVFEHHAEFSWKSPEGSILQLAPASAIAIAGLLLGRVDRTVRRGTIEWVAGPEAGRTDDLSRIVSTVGTRCRSAVSVDRAPGVEPTHFRINLREPAATLEPCGHVSLNGECCEALTTLSDGDLVAFGPHTIAFRPR